MRRALRNGWLRWAGATALALVLAACGASSDEGSASNIGPFPRDWYIGGQTGSLMPACGLSAAAIESGVPASAPGVVLRTDDCNDPSAFDDLTVRDPSGQPVAFSLMRLPDGSLLINLQGGLVPGRYSIDVEPELPSDDDGGMELDASIAPPLPDAGKETLAETIEVDAELPRPQRFGTIERLGDECNTVLTFVPDNAVLPFLSVLSIELQIDDGPTRPLVLTGGLPVEDGVARVSLPANDLNALSLGFHELRIVVRIAGESVPLETFLLSVEEPCGFSGSESAASPAYEDDDAHCSVSAAGSRDRSQASGAFLAFALYALRKRRRRKRV